jgi:hypothetical protein
MASATSAAGPHGRGGCGSDHSPTLSVAKPAKRFPRALAYILLLMMGILLENFYSIAGFLYPLWQNVGKQEIKVGNMHWSNNQDRASSITLAICAIVKDEAPYLAEWIEHHKLIGFDYILLYNDGSTDDTQCILDAYAQKNDITRIPEDIGSEYMKDLPVYGGIRPDNAQYSIFEVCRRYLVDEELKTGEVGSTWMLTTDADEFLWFDEQFGNAKSTLVAMISELRSKQSEVRSFVIPNCVFGSSGQETFEPGLLMKRFVQRDKNTYCDPFFESSWAMKGKAFSKVSSIMKDQKISMHSHTVANSTSMQKASSLIDVFTVGRYMRVAHYKAKSREEVSHRECALFLFHMVYLYSNLIDAGSSFMPEFVPASTGNGRDISILLSNPFQKTK